ncbi:hypothetical protein D3C79_742530 [compost metagenome]
MLFQRFVDIEHGVLWLIEAGQQLVHHDQQLEGIILIGKAFDKRLGIDLLILSADIILPPLGNQRGGRFIHLGVAFPTVGWAHHHCRLEQPHLIEVFFIEHRRGLAVASQLALEPLVDVGGKVIGDIECDQLDTIFRAVDLTLAGEFAFQIGLLLLA